MSGVTAKEWWVFREYETHYGFGTEETAKRYLLFLNQYRAINHYQMDRLNDVFPTPVIADVQRSSSLVDMEEQMIGWES